MSGLEKTPPRNSGPTHSRNSSHSSRHSHMVRHSRDWEIMEDLQSELSTGSEHLQELSVPGLCEGFLMKKRKWPLNGWHKRYFVLEKGILRYGKTQQDVQRGKIHGSVDVSLAVMSVNKKSKRIDLDAGDNLYHMKSNGSPWCIAPILIDTSCFISELNSIIRHKFMYTSSLSVQMEVQSRLTKVHSLSSSDSSDESFCTVRQEQVLPSHSLLSLLPIVGFSCKLRKSNGVCLDFPGSLPHFNQPTPSLSRHPMRTPSLAESAAEYFDASEVLNCESSSENEASDESGLSDVTTSNSDPEDISRADLPRALRADTGHRTALPAPCPDNSHIGLMTILYNNIGKDLSRVSMPVALNEPLCLLQRMCEDLEYSDLLDTASHTPDPYERMVYIAAFVISGYAWATYRNRYKPFNPVLGETYECVQEERGFRYVSEQVSHHPPISACHAESENFTFWQDQRFKNKFWGKSLEIIPTGMVNVTLPKFGDHYEWNKVVTCIHNVLSQQRWLEHYGEVLIRNINSTVCTCKMVFMKSRSWGSDNNVNEVQGQVLNEAGEVVHHFGGFWHEGIVCDTLPVPKCIWKPNPQPKNSYDYYGFSRMAMELNELIPEKQSMLPPTDTRFRPDQRLLEGGKVSEADKCKDEVEEKQRRRRKLLAKMGEEHVPRFFT
uniref:Oxysterol-binding protein n=1 Tax=Scleropages formosus TaxID=113540 RepID=A0A8D0CDJ8_SCLFO